MADDNKFGERLAVLEQKEDNNNGRIKNHAIRLERLESDNVLLTRMLTLQEVQTQSIKEHSEQMKEFGKVMGEVNQNLSNLNTKYDQMESSMESRFEHMGNEMQTIKQTQKEESDKTKISTGELVKNIFVALIMIIPTAISMWVLIKLGLK